MMVYLVVGLVLAALLVGYIGHKFITAKLKAAEAAALAEANALKQSAVNEAAKVEKSL